MSKRNQDPFLGESAEDAAGTPAGKSDGDAAGNSKSGEPQAVRTPQVRATACPKNPELHENTRVYKTLGTVRYCVCDDCGHTWKQHGPPATPKPAKEKDRSPA